MAHMIEKLEERRLLSFVHFNHGHGGTVKIMGDNGNDTVDIALDKSDPSILNVTYDGELHQFNAGSVNRIDIKLKKGSDTVNIDDAVLIDAWIDGGKGDDQLKAGGGNDHVKGGGGTNMLTGGPGSDRFLAGANDTVTDFDSAEGDIMEPPQPVEGEPGELVITGTENPDLVSVNLDQLDPTKFVVNVNGTPTTYNLADFTKITINLLGGADVASVDSLITLPVAMNGGADSDELTGGGGDDAIDGGADVDQLTGQAGADHFINDDTDDITDFNAGEGDTRDVDPTGGGGVPVPPTGVEIVENGTDGDDIIYLLIDEGDNTRYQLIVNDVSTFFTIADVTKIELNGGLGDDTIQMDLTIIQPATITGGPGKDFIAGAAGNDTLDGGTEDDNMYGNGGADSFLNVDIGDQVTDFNPGEGDTQTASGSAVVNSAPVAPLSITVSQTSIASSPPVVTFTPLVDTTPTILRDAADDAVRRDA